MAIDNRSYAGGGAPPFQMQPTQGGPGGFQWGQQPSPMGPQGPYAGYSNQTGGGFMPPPMNGMPHVPPSTLAAMRGMTPEMLQGIGMDPQRLQQLVAAQSGMQNGAGGGSFTQMTPPRQQGPTNFMTTSGGYASGRPQQMPGSPGGWQRAPPMRDRPTRPMEPSPQQPVLGGQLSKPMNKPGVMQPGTGEKPVIRGRPEVSPAFPTDEAVPKGGGMVGGGMGPAQPADEAFAQMMTKPKPYRANPKWTPSNQVTKT